MNKFLTCLIVYVGKKIPIWFEETDKIVKHIVFENSIRHSCT